MELFWEHGYEGTTLEDLQAAMGDISPTSLYHAFGSKEALFRQAAEKYQETVGGPALRALNGSPTAREAIHQMLRLTADPFAVQANPTDACSSSAQSTAHRPTPGRRTTCSRSVGRHPR